MMLEICRAAVANMLRPLALKETLTEEKDAGAYKAMPYAILAWGDEDLQRGRRRLGHTDDIDAGVRTIFEQRALRTLLLQVRLVAETTQRLDELVTKFLAGVPARIADPDLGQITVGFRGAETPVTEGVARREAQWEVTIEFSAPVVSSRTVRLFRLATVTLEDELIR